MEDRDESQTSAAMAATSRHEADAERLRRLVAAGSCRWCGEKHPKHYRLCPQSGKEICRTC